MNRIFAIGDIHGSKKPIERFVKLYSIDKNDVIILLGDAGLNYFFNRRDYEIKKFLDCIGCTFFIIRGNHEERPSILLDRMPFEWHTENYFDNIVYVENDFPHIKYALDTVAYYNINGYKTLVIPGAYSVDKYYRLANGWSWFENEQLSEKEKNEGIRLIEKNNWQTDIILSHTCPRVYQPIDLFLSTVNQKKVDNSMEIYLDSIEFSVDYKLWLWGHYHQYRTYSLFNDRHQIMLFNDKAIEINEIMQNAKEFTEYSF